MSEDENMDIVHGDDHQAMLSNLNRATGSNLYTFGDNIVQCHIFGPNPLATSLNLLKKNYFSVFIYPLGKIRNMTKDKKMFYYEHFFRRTFSPMVDHGHLPRSRSFVVLNEIEKGSSLITTCLNATSLGLLDSGYPLSYYLGCSTIILDQDDSRLYTESEYRDLKTPRYRSHEPIELDFESSYSSIKARFHFVSKNTEPCTNTGIIAEGRFSLDQFIEAHHKSRDPINRFFSFSKDKVRERFL